MSTSSNNTPLTTPINIIHMETPPSSPPPFSRKPSGSSSEMSAQKEGPPGTLANIISESTQAKASKEDSYKAKAIFCTLVSFW